MHHGYSTINWTTNVSHCLSKLVITSIKIFNIHIVGNKALDYFLICLKFRLIVLSMNFLPQIVNGITKNLRTTLFQSINALTFFCKEKKQN